jgi:hypothetical protein
MDDGIDARERTGDFALDRIPVDELVVRVGDGAHPNGVTEVSHAASR